MGDENTFSSIKNQCKLNEVIIFSLLYFFRKSYFYKPLSYQLLRKPTQNLINFTFWSMAKIEQNNQQHQYKITKKTLLTAIPTSNYNEQTIKNRKKIHVQSQKIDPKK